MGNWSCFSETNHRFDVTWSRGIVVCYLSVDRNQKATNNNHCSSARGLEQWKIRTWFSLLLGLKYRFLFFLKSHSDWLKVKWRLLHLNSFTPACFRWCMCTGHWAVCSCVKWCSALGCGDAVVHAEPEVGSDSEEDRWIHQPPQSLLGTLALSITMESCCFTERWARMRKKGKPHLHRA